MDCAPNPNQCGGTGGCDGATAEVAFDYVANARGWATEKTYPYKGFDWHCDFDDEMPAAVTLSGFEVVKSNDLEAFQEALMNVGPLAIAVAAEPWMYYQGGVFDKCTGDKGSDIDHGVQVVGW